MCGVDDTPHTGTDVRTDAHTPAIARSEPLLGVGEVMARYGLRDRRTARRVMDAAGAFVVARRLLVREADLVVYENTLRTARQQHRLRAARPDGRRRPAGTVRDASANRELPPGWWRTDGA